jgi:hypothetical protein
MIDTEWIDQIKAKNMAFLHLGVENGWWDGVDERRGMPIPFPIIINLFNKPAGFLMAHAVHEAGLFSSISEARKAGWNKPAIPGEFWLFKRTKRLLLIYVEE